MTATVPIGAHSMSTLVAMLMLDEDRVPNEEAIALAPTVGWLMLIGAIALVVMLILHREGWRRWWLTAEDPRSLALYRIVFGFFVICNMNDFFEYFHFLFTDEGIFTADVARQVHAQRQFEGFGDGFNEQEPWGFFDIWAFIRFLEGPKYSLLYIWDSPEFFWGHMIAFYAVATCFIVGFRTRLSGILTFLLMNSVFFRNHLFWEGTELVYRVFLAYLVCSRCGYAYSVDNWLRCRRLRRQGRLSERHGPGHGAGVAPSVEHPLGLEPVYRSIPAWPRRLAIVQLAAVYADTGILKNGSVWANGDAIYYAWNMDHFYRFYPQAITAMFGTNLLRIMTWSTHWGESFFFLCAIGLIARFAMDERIPPMRGIRSLVVRLGWLALIVISATLIAITWHVHFTPRIVMPVFVGLWVGLMCGIWWCWNRLGRRPIPVRGRTGLWIVYGLFIALIDLFLGILLFPLLNAKQAMDPRIIGLKAAIMAAWTLVAVGLPIAVRRIAPVMRRLERLPMFTPDFLGATHELDRRWLATWVLGRRVWITWHIATMGGIFVLMNIGQFQTGMLCQAFVYFTGLEIAWFLQTIGFRLGFTRHRVPLPSEDPTLPEPPREPLPPFWRPLRLLGTLLRLVFRRPHRLHHDAAQIPGWALFVTLAVILVGLILRVEMKLDWDWRWIWVSGVAFLAGVAARKAWVDRSKRLSSVNPDTGRVRTPWAFGPFSRFIVSSLLVWHIVAVVVWLLPDKDCLSTWRGDSRKVFSQWLTTTQTDQGWGMFAPNPPRSNVFLKVLVTDAKDEIYDLKTDVYAPERKPIPWIWNDRMRKMNRRIIGGESGNTQWYRKWYARYICRDWAMKHDGIEPKKIDLVKVWYRIPRPEETLRKGYYSPEDLLARTGKEKIEHTEYCQKSIMGQLSPELRERHGLPPAREGWTYRPWIKHKKRKWEHTMAEWTGQPAPQGPEASPATRKASEAASRQAAAQAAGVANAASKATVGSTPVPPTNVAGTPSTSPSAPGIPNVTVGTAPKPPVAGIPNPTASAGAGSTNPNATASAGAAPTPPTAQ